MIATEPGNTKYKLETVARAFAILRHFSDPQESLSLSEVVERTGFERTIVFRILRTLEEEGVLRRPEGRRYYSNFIFTTQSRYRIGYASQSSDSVLLLSDSGPAGPRGRSRFRAEPRDRMHREPQLVLERGRPRHPSHDRSRSASATVLRDRLRGA